MEFHSFLKELQKNSRLYFTLEEAVKATKSSKIAISNAISHLKKKGDIMSPFRGLYIIIPLAYKHVGCLNPRDVVAISMKFLKIPYYVGLLTAAQYYGATHQMTFVYQVVTNKRIRKEISCGDIRIQFIYKKDMSGIKTEEKMVDLGYITISSPEQTAKDLMVYSRRCGGLNHEATVLAELVQAIDSRKLVALGKVSKNMLWMQRMGYILERIDTFYPTERDRAVLALKKFLMHQKLRYIALNPEMPIAGPRDEKWHIIENETVDSDI